VNLMAKQTSLEDRTFLTARSRGCRPVMLVR
jgi:hypothetical protein